MTFKQVKIGCTFFDTFSGEYYLKLSDTTAEQVSGGSYFEGVVAEFGMDDDIELVEGE